MKEFLPEIKDSKYIVPLALFVFSFFVRISLISKGPYSLDSLLVVNAALQTIKTHQLQYFHDFRYPLVIVLLTGAISLLKGISINDPIYAYNLLSVVFSSIAVSLYYVCVQKLLNKLTAFISSMMLTLCPIYLGLSVYGTGNVVSLFFFFLAVCFMLQHNLEKKRKYILLSSISFGFMLASRMQDMILLIPALLSCCFIFEGKKFSYEIVKEKLGNFSLYLFRAFFVGTVFYLPAILKNMQRSQLDYRWNIVASKIPSENFLAFFVEAVFRNVSLVILSLSVMGFVLAIIGFVILFFRKRRIFFFCFVWIAAPLLILSCLKFTGPRLLVLIVPPLLLSQGYLLSTMFKKGKVLRGLSIALFIGITSSMFLKVYPILLYRHNNALLPDYARQIEEFSKSGDVIICHDEALFIRYYANRKTIRRPKERDLFSREAMMKYKDEINKLLDRGVSVYSTWPGMYASEHPRVFEYLINKYFEVEELEMMPYEDWHRGPTRQQIYSFPVYKIKKR